MSNQNPKLTPHSSPQRSQRAWVEVLQTVGLSIFLAVGMRAYVAEARFIPSGSMQPTLEINDRLIIDKVTYRFDDPKRGDIVVFSPPPILKEQNVRDDLIKRVIGLPGDEVEIRNGEVRVNGELLSESYIKETIGYDFGPVTVPADNYLVLGDNRNNSFDSHAWGFVPSENIIGRALVRYWPPNRIGEISPTPSYRAPE
ncbi:MAG: signal peptidase I [Leptolyngbyaceae bacterium]|nr:signal peptidase I [Leptolyngbyaceae bacterium]